MSNTFPIAAALVVAAADGTATNPPISFGGAGGAGSNNSGTGLYGSYTALSACIGGSDVLALASTGATLTGTLAVSGASTLTGAATLSSTLAVTGVATMATRASINGIVIMAGAGAPTDGTTGANIAGIGSLYSDKTAGVLYINTGTLGSPTWTKVGTQS